MDIFFKLWYSTFDFEIILALNLHWNEKKKSLSDVTETFSVYAKKYILSPYIAKNKDKNYLIQFTKYTIKWFKNKLIKHYIK